MSDVWDELDALLGGGGTSIKDGFTAARDIFAEPESDGNDFERDGRGRPKIILPDGATTTYSRVTTFIKVLDDTSQLTDWKVRMSAAGILAASMPDLRRLNAAIEADEKRTVNAIVHRLAEDAGMGSAAKLGTAIHALTERYDIGLSIGANITNAAHLEAYIHLTKGFTPLSIEAKVVCDEIKAAGTPDRIWETGIPCPRCGRTIYVGDVKTGRVDQYTERSIAMQVGIYAHSKYYEVRTGKRTELGDVCQDRGIIVDLPSQSKTPMTDSRLVWIDIKTGWELVDTAVAVHAARKKKGLIEPWQK